MPARARKANLPAVPKLNLIPPHIAAAKRMTAALIGTVVAVILILLGMGAWWQSNAATIARLEQDLQEKTRQADEVRQIQQQAQTIESGIKALADRLAVLDDIRRSGKQLAQLGREIGAWVPRGVRLTALQFQGGGGAGTPPAGPVMPGAPPMGPEVAGMPGPPGMSPTPAGGTQVTTVIMHGYTTSLQRLRDFFSQLSQADLFSSVQLVSFEWQGRVYSGSNLQPVLPRPKTSEKTLTPTSPTAPGQAPPTAPGGMGGPPEMGMHGGSPGTPGMGMHSSAPSGPPIGAPAMGAPGMGMHGGGMPGAPMGPMMPGMGPTGGSASAAFVRDPTAPRNAVYFIIQATLARPLQIAAKLQPPAAAMGGGMPGMAPGAMGPAPGPGAPGMEAPPPAAGALPSGGSAPSTGSEAAPRGLGRRGAAAAGEE